MFFLYTTPSDPSDEDGIMERPIELYAKKRVDICPAIRFFNGKKVVVIQK